MLRSGVTARRIGDARARDDSPATGDRRPRAPRTAHLPAVFSRATKLNQVLQVYTQVRQEETPNAHTPRDVQFMRRVAQSFSTRTLESYKYTCGSNKHDS